MGFIIALLTFILVLDCLLLVFLVLIQLPKKDAGAGLAFGGAATDALFGAGSGTVLTKVTKYAAIVFFILTLLLSVLQGRYYTRHETEFNKALQNSPSKGRSALPVTPETQQPATAATTGTNALTAPAVESTNLPAPAATNTAPAPATTTNAPSATAPK